MAFHRSSNSRSLTVLCGLLILLAASRRLAGEPTLAAVAAFNTYAGAVEARLAQQHRSRDGFLAAGALGLQNEARLRRGDLVVERLTPSEGAVLPGALLHHWRATAFARGTHAADFERLMKEVDAYPQHFAPEVIEARTVAENGDRLEAWMRVRQRHVITVVMDTSYDIRFGRLDAQHGYSVSRSTRIVEIDSPGTESEHALDASQEHGFLWRLNTYWNYEERDGGLYMQVETVSLTRSIPHGLGWAVGPFVESIPRESLEFTLRATCNALRR